MALTSRGLLLYCYNTETLFKAMKFDQEKGEKGTREEEKNRWHSTYTLLCSVWYNNTHTCLGCCMTAMLSTPLTLPSPCRHPQSGESTTSDKSHAPLTYVRVPPCPTCRVMPPGQRGAPDVPHHGGTGEGAGVTAPRSNSLQLTNTLASQLSWEWMILDASWEV